ncbi:MAG: amino acid synthesis family protein [Desulfovibrionaceae bacterium]|nr:amino acid synthesis family protein [Desulfovibrionaceae bacterium]
MPEKFSIRKKGAIIDVIETHFGKKLDRPITRVATMAVINNPYGDEWQEDVSEIDKYGGIVGEMLAGWGAQLIGGVERVQSLGKAAICGENVETELMVAAFHPEFGQGIRRAMKGLTCKAMIIATHAVGPMGHMLTIPLYHREALRVRDNFDAMEVRLEGAPKADEILLICALADGGRPFPRINTPTTPTHTTFKGQDGLI